MEYELALSKQLLLEYDFLGGLVVRFKEFLQFYKMEQQPVWASSKPREFVADLAHAIDVDIPGHFAVEEKTLFPLMETDGYGEIVEILRKDHKKILETAKTILPIVSKLLYEAAPLTPPEWELLHGQVNALVTDLLAHAGREEEAIKPALENIFDESQGEEVYQRYQRIAEAYQAIHKKTVT